MDEINNPMALPTVVAGGLDTPPPGHLGAACNHTGGLMHELQDEMAVPQVYSQASSIE